MVMTISGSTCGASKCLIRPFHHGLDDALDLGLLALDVAECLFDVVVEGALDRLDLADEAIDPLLHQDDLGLDLLERLRVVEGVDDLLHLGDLGQEGLLGDQRLHARGDPHILRARHEGIERAQAGQEVRVGVVELVELFELARLEVLQAVLQDLELGDDEVAQLVLGVVSFGWSL